MACRRRQACRAVAEVFSDGRSNSKDATRYASVLDEAVSMPGWRIRQALVGKDSDLPGHQPQWRTPVQHQPDLPGI